MDVCSFDWQVCKNSATCLLFQTHYLTWWFVYSLSARLHWQQLFRIHQGRPLEWSYNVWHRWHSAHQTITWTITSGCEQSLTPSFSFSISTFFNATFLPVCLCFALNTSLWRDEQETETDEELLSQRKESRWSLFKVKTELYVWRQLRYVQCEQSHE